MRLGRQFMHDAALGEWIRKNPDKVFALATPKGIHTFKSKFTSHEEINAEHAKQEKLKTMFFYDEATELNEDVLGMLSKSKDGERNG